MRKLTLTVQIICEVPDDDAVLGHLVVEAADELKLTEIGGYGRPLSALVVRASLGVVES